MKANITKGFAPAWSMLAALLVTLLGLTGCWTPPNATVQPAGKPGLIQAHIPVEIIQNGVSVESLDADGRIITLKRQDGAHKTFYVAQGVKNLDAVKAGDRVEATIKAELSVYILDHGKVPNADGTFHPRTINFNAKVLQVDPSYRLLTLQFEDGNRMVIKAGLDVMLEKMAPGDDVVMRANLITAIKIEKP